MPIKKILFLLFLTAPAFAWADLDCGIDERPIIQTITVNEQANDLFLIPIYNPGTGEDELLATGGSGTLTDILNTWNENESSIGSNSFNIDTLSFTDTDAEFLENLGNSRYMVQFCLPNSTNSTTSHAVYKQGATVRGIFSGVGIVTGIGGNNEIDLILNHSNYSPKFSVDSLNSTNLSDAYRQAYSAGKMKPASTDYDTSANTTTATE